MIKTVTILCLSIYSHLIFGQDEVMFRKGQFQVTLSYNLSPIRKNSSQIGFKYVDGDQNANYLIDTISADYNLPKRYFTNAISVGVGYFLTNNVRTSVNFKPYLNSFLSNKSKNGEVYGVQFDIGINYFVLINNDINISFGTTASRIIGGFGITSGGAKNKEYLVVNGNELYDNDIGFHIIDNCWAISPSVALYYKAFNNFIIFANSGFQFNFGRASRMNFAGLQKDGTVKWNSKGYDDADVTLTVDDIKISNDNINKLPYRFSGLLFELGTVINLNKRQ